MKVADKTMNKKDKVRKKRGVDKPKPKKEQVLVVAQEIKYARWLSGNDKKTRDRVLKALKKWILNCFEKGYEFKEDDFTRVWKGLFYAVWMSDKPLIQEELCENISQVLDLFPVDQLKPALLMTKAGFKMLATEWYGIDHHRMDKFLMLVRRYLRGSLRCLERCEWSLLSCQKYAKMLSGTDGLFALKTPHYARNATSMLMHFTDCFLEELSKISEGKIPEESVAALLQPFVQYTCSGSTLSLCAAARRLLTALLRQSEEGLQYEEKTRAWKQMGCPGGGPDALERASDDDEPVLDGDAASDDELDDGPKPLDPRAGRVDVALAPLPVPARLLADMLRDLLAHATSKAHRRVNICLQRFETLARGQYPLPVSAPEVSPRVPAAAPRRAARALQQLDHQLKLDADELKLRGLSRKHKKRLLKRSRAGLSIVEELREYKSLSNASNNGEWVVESTETKPKKAEDTSNKENQDKTKANGKLNAQKRKHNPELANGDVNNKKQKLDKNNKRNLVNNLQKLNKKNSLDSNTRQSQKDKNKVNHIKSNKVADDKSQRGTAVLENKGTKQKVDAKGKDAKPTKDVKTKPDKDIKDGKAKKAKNQPQIISHQIQNDKIKNSDKTIKTNKVAKPGKTVDKPTNPIFLANKVKNFQKQLPNKDKPKKDLAIKKNSYESPKKVKFALKNNSMQKPVDYYKSVRQSPSIPFDSAKKPSKTNLKPSTPSPINPFFKKKLRMKN